MHILTDIPTTPTDYKPTAWLNTDYKTLACTRANRLRPTLSDMLHPSQYCGVPGNTIFVPLAKARSTIAYAELTHATLCTLYLVFIAAFDMTSHIYLLQMLKSLGHSIKFITHIQVMYDKDFSLLQINRYVAGPFPLQCSVRRDCPMSILLSALVFNPLIFMLK